MTPVPNQPIGFGYAPDCNLLRGPFKLLAQDGDVTQFQFRIDDCRGYPSLTRNGNFTEAGGSGVGWTTSSPTSWILQPYFGRVKHIAGTAQSCYTQAILVSDGTLLRIRFTIEQTQGQCSVTMGNWTENYTGAVNGTFEYWIIADGITSFSFCCKGISDASIGTISWHPFDTNFIGRLVDLDGNEIVTNIPYTIYNGWATFSFNWDDANIPFGCYRFEVADPCECAQLGLLGLDLYTGSFPSAINPWAWSPSSSWLIAGGGAVYTGSSVPGTASTFLLNSPLCVGTAYTVTYTLTAMANNSFRVALGSTQGILRTTDGTFTEVITCATSGTLSIIGQSVGSVDNFTVTDISIRAVNLNYSHVSDVFAYGPENCKTHLLTICNDSDAFGMGFVGTGFGPSVRLHSHMRDGVGFPSTRNAYTDSNGRSSTYYGVSRENYEFAFGAPSYVHRFARLGVIADHVYIDDDEYFIEADEYPTPALNDVNDIAGIAIPMSKKAENTRNRRLNDVVHGCSPDGVLLINAEGPTVTGGRPHDGGRPLSTEGKPINFNG